MTKKCVVVGCVVNENATFHRIPTKLERRNVWLRNLNLPNSTNGRVCSKHFKNDDFQFKFNGFKWLKPNADPIILDVHQHQHEEMEHLDCETEIVIGNDNRDAEDNVPIVTRNVYKEHNYSKFPKTIRENFFFINNKKLRKINSKLLKKLRMMQRQQEKEMKKFENFSKLSPFLQELFLILMKHHKPKSTPKMYSALIRKFAISLHYHSPAGYTFVRSLRKVITFLFRSEFNKCLPHTQTIACWYRVIDGSPGFTNQSLDAITELQERTPFPIVVNIVLDGMAIRKHLQRIGNRIIGYTDLGGVLPEADSKLQLAKESLIYLAVGVNVPFKIPIGYFLINALTGKQLSYLSQRAITLVSNCKVVVGSLIFDGPYAHFVMAKELGCNFDNMEDIVSSFDVEEQKVFIFPDMCHMEKLARNFVCDEGIFLDGKNRVISWKYFLNLNNFQTSLGFHLANKLRKLHVNYRNSIMKVYLATQLLSASVADAIQFCDVTLQLPDFKYSEGTVEFIRVMNDLFDIFNSRDMDDKFYKQPLHKNNYDFIMSRLYYIRTYLLNLKHQNGTPVYLGPRKTFVVGMLTLIKSLEGFYHEFVEKKQMLAFVPTYKMSQDSAEIFNCAMRSFGGYNTNPSAVTFGTAYKRSLLHIQFHPKFSGNCRSLEDMPILNCKSSNKPIVHSAQYISEEQFEESFQNAVMFKSFRINWQAYYCVIAHISGYIARRLCALLKCPPCSSALICQEDENCDYEVIDDITDTRDECHDDIIDEMEMDEQVIPNSTVLEFDGVGGMEGVVFNGCDYEESGSKMHANGSLIDEYDSVIDENDFMIDETENNDNGEELDSSYIDHSELDIGQIDEIAKKYFDLIKKKDRGGLFFPSDSLYRVSILADIVFTTALKESGGKMLARTFTLDRLVLEVHRMYYKYENVIFFELREHFQSDGSHLHSLIENIAKFYLKIRINYLNKIVSANSGKRQKNIHEIHFQGM